MLSLMECINHITNQYDELTSYFQTSDECNCLVEVDRIGIQWKDTVVKCCFLFLQAMFTHFNKVIAVKFPVLLDLFIFRGRSATEMYSGMLCMATDADDKF